LAEKAYDLVRGATDIDPAIRTRIDDPFQRHRSPKPAKCMAVGSARVVPSCW
jgi:hypothetical protein